MVFILSQLNQDYIGWWTTYIYEYSVPVTLYEYSLPYISLVQNAKLEYAALFQIMKITRNSWDLLKECQCKENTVCNSCTKN